jgi:hypothetical protein
MGESAQGTNWERFLFPVYSPKPHPELRDLTLSTWVKLGFQSNRFLRYAWLTIFGNQPGNKFVQNRLKLGLGISSRGMGPDRLH